METYDKGKIGRCIAWTGDHQVYEYDSAEVIKFSKFDYFLGFEKAKDKSLLDIELCRNFFGRYFLDTRVAISSKENRVALVQLKIVGRYLVPRDLKNETIKNQFIDIMHGYNHLVAAGHSPVDLIGGKGVLIRGMSNIFVTPNDRLYLFDATLLDSKDFPLLCRPFLSALFGLAIHMQTLIIRSFESNLS